MPASAETPQETPGNAARRGRPRRFEEERFLDGAIALFRSGGFTGVSIGDLTAATGLTTGSLYKAYKDKEGVFARALARYIALREERIRARLADAPDARARIAELLRDYVALSRGQEGRLGCMVVAGITDLDRLGDSAATLQTQITSRRAMLEGLIAEGQEDGSIPAATDPAAAAETLLALLQGLRVVGKAGGLSGEDEALITCALRLLG